MDKKKLFESGRPKIGIRVIVDGRYNGVREKIEGPTFALAEKAKNLLEKHVYCPDSNNFFLSISGLPLCFLQTRNKIRQKRNDFRNKRDQQQYHQQNSQVRQHCFDNLFKGHL